MKPRRHIYYYAYVTLPIVVPCSYVVPFCKFLRNMHFPSHNYLHTALLLPEYQIPHVDTLLSITFGISMLRFTLTLQGGTPTFQCVLLLTGVVTQTTQTPEELSACVMHTRLFINCRYSRKESVNLVTLSDRIFGAICVRKESCRTPACQQRELSTVVES